VNLPVTYDITRLLTRVLNATPNGIDRVDLAYAENFLAGSNEVPALVHMGPLGHRAFTGVDVSKAISSISTHLGETSLHEDSDRLAAIEAWINGLAGKPAAKSVQERKPFSSNLQQKLSYRHVLSFHLRTLGGLGRHPERALPQGCRYLCVSQYPLSVVGAYNWLQKRPDIKPVFFVHDLLPFQFPEYFKTAERGRHQIRMNNLAQHAAAALVSTEAVADELRAEMHKRGRREFPVHLAPMPLAAAFEKPIIAISTSAPYFVMCGTIEPRKNHLTLLHVWRDLATRYGSRTPKLVLVGARGWENENIIDLLERAPAMREHVLEVNGLATPDLAQLMAGSTALLMPSFGEGYGLPVAEALALGVPVIASDIPVFHEVAGLKFKPLDPIDSKGWRKAIEAACFSKSRPLFAKRRQTKVPVDFVGLRAMLNEL
jgi:glycosyltransferase involved in cell wall biosynthesis